jgi:hypothetical protein
MAILAIFDVPGMTAEQYDGVDAELNAKGAREPEGRISHVAGPTDGGWLVVDTWESTEAMGAFAEVLMPILAEAGVQEPEPRILPVHNLIN